MARMALDAPQMTVGRDHNVLRLLDVSTGAWGPGNGDFTWDESAV